MRLIPLPRFFNEPRYARSAGQSGAQFSRSSSGLVKLALRPATQPKKTKGPRAQPYRITEEIQNQNLDHIQRLVSDYLELRYGQTHNKAREIWIKEQPEAATLLQLLDQTSYDQKNREAISRHHAATRNKSAEQKSN